MYSLREKFKSVNTLVCLLQGLQGRETTIELRKEDSVSGKIDHVDAYMNTQMSNVTLTPVRGEQMHFDIFYVQGKNIRYVHVPDEVNLMQLIRKQLGAAHDAKLGDRLRKPQSGKSKMKFKTPKSENKHQGKEKYTTQFDVSGRHLAKGGETGTIDKSTPDS